MIAFDQREYGSVASNECDRAGYIPSPTHFRATCLHDGTYRIDSLGTDPATQALDSIVSDPANQLPVHTLTSYNGWAAIAQNTQPRPDGMDVWHKNYTINDTFRTEDIGTFKEIHCEVKKCDVNTF